MPSISLLGLVLSHRENSCLLQYPQSPQAITGRMMTRSPGERFFTSGPTSSMIPMASWPMMSPFCMAALRSPAYM